MPVEKEMHTLEVENYVSFGRHPEALSPGDSLSGGSGGELQRGRGGAWIYTRFCHKNQVVGTSKDYCELKKKQTSQVKDVWEDSGVWPH